MIVPKARRLPSGSWFVRLRLGGVSVPITAPTEKMVTREAATVKADYLAGKRSVAQMAPKRLPTIRQAIDDYIADRSNTLSPATIRGYGIIQRNRFKGIMDRSMSDLTDEDLKKAVNDEAALCSPKTVTNAWRFIGTILREKAKREPPEVTLPQIPPNMRPWLDYDEIRLFVAAAKGDRYEIPALLALSSLRRSEIYAIDWAQVQLAKRRIRIAGAIVPDADHRFVKKSTNKNVTSTRWLPILMDQLYDALDAMPDKTGPVCKGNPDVLRLAINRICRRAGVPEVGVQGLRYSFASLAYHLNIPEKDTMEIGGWKDDKTMHKIYTRISQADVKKYEGALSDFYNRPQKRQ